MLGSWAEEDLRQLQRGTRNSPLVWLLSQGWLLPETMSRLTAHLLMTEAIGPEGLGVRAEEGPVGKLQASRLVLSWPKRARHSLPHFAASGAIHTITFC